MKLFRKLLKTILAVVAGAIASAPSPLLACAACTGRTDSPLAVGMNWGIVTLLGFASGLPLALTGNYFDGLAIEDCVQRSFSEWARLCRKALQSSAAPATSPSTV